MTTLFRRHPVAIAAALLASGLITLPAHAQSTTTAAAEAPELATVVIKTKRENRVS
jgi:hypothetical protein